MLRYIVIKNNGTMKMEILFETKKDAERTKKVFFNGKGCKVVKVKLQIIA